jgi:O-antigen ligase
MSERLDAAAPSARSKPWWRFIDNLGCAWVLLLLGSMSVAESTTAAASLSGQMSSANLIRYACLMLALACIAPDLRHRIGVRFNPIWLFAAYVVVCLLSTLWSISPVVTLGKAVELSAATATILFAANRVASERALSQLFELSFVMSVLILVVLVAGYYSGAEGFYLPSHGVIQRMMNAWFISANGIGYLSALTATIALDRMFSKRSDWRLMAAVVVLTLATAIPAQGRTGLFCLIIGGTTVLAIHRQYVTLLVGGVAALLVGAMYASEIQAYLVRGDDIENIQSMSGRAEMWRAAWDAFLEKPLAGSGFGVGGRALFLTTLSGFSTYLTSLHNGFFELLTGVGLLGVMPWLSALLWTIRNAFVSGLRRVRTEQAAIVPLLLVMTIMSTGAGGWFDTLVGYYLCCAAILGRPLRLQRPSAAAPRAPSASIRLRRS